MKIIFTVCIVFSILSTIIRIIFNSEGEKIVCGAVNFIITISLLLFILRMPWKEEIPKIKFESEENATIYDTVLNSTVKEAVSVAEKSLSEELCVLISKEFKISSVDCVIDINYDTLNVETVEIYIESKQLLSTYEIKKYILNLFGEQTEVKIL